MLWQEKREVWVLLKIPRGDIDGVGEEKIAHPMTGTLYKGERNVVES